MSVKQDKVQIILEFLNEESKSLGKHIIDAKNLNKEISDLSKEEQKLGREFEKTTAAGKDTLAIEQKRTKVQAEINDKLMAVLKTGKGIENLDLSKVVPQQLIATAKDLERSLSFLPKSTPQYEAAAAALKKVNDQLATNRAETKGVASGMQAVATEGINMANVFETAFGVGIAEIIGNLIAKVKELGIELFHRATELEVIENKTKLVFGKAANDIKQFAAVMAGEVGLSTDSVLSDLNDIANSFTTLEFNKADVAGLTKQLYELSASWAQYNGGKYTALEVSEKFKVALGGEVDELAELGIVLTEDTLKKEMQKKGYDKLTGASFDQASALTLLELITRKTQEAQTNFGNNAETMAAKQNRVAAFVHNAWDATARGLTTVFSGLLSYTERLSEPFKDLTPRMTNLQKVTEAERVSLDFAVQNVLRYNVGSNERKKAIDALIKINPTFLAGLNAETATNEQLANRLQVVNQQYLAKIIAIETSKEVEKANNAETKSQEAKLKSQINLQQKLGEATDILGDKTLTYEQTVRKLRERIDQGIGTNMLGLGREQQALYDLVGAKNRLSAVQGILNSSIEAGVKADFKRSELIERLKKQHPELAAALDEVTKATDRVIEKNKNYSAGVNFAKEYDPEALKKKAAEAKKALEDAQKFELESIKAATERKLIVLEKEKLEGTKIGEVYTNEYAKIRTDGFSKELEVYKKYKESESLEAARVSKELVEIEKNRSEAVLRLRLDDADKQAAFAKAIAERSFLQNTEGDVSPQKFDTEDRAYKKALLVIEIQFAEEKQRILKDAHKEETKEYVDQQNRILKAKADIRGLEQGQTEADNKDAAHRRSLAIDAEIAELEEANVREDGVLKIRFANLMMTEMEMSIASLNFKRAMLAQEIEILKTGGEAEIKQAKQKGIELAATDAEIELQKIKNKKRTVELEKELQQTKFNMASDALSIAIDLLSKDEAARKKHAKAIQAFEIAQTWIKSFSEIAGIWKNANENPLNAIVPGWGTGFATIQTGFAVARAAATTQKIAATKYAKGGFTSDVGIGTDETGEKVAGVVHAGEWVGNRQMVEKYPQLFKTLELMQRGGRPFADGGTVGFNLLPRTDLVTYSPISYSGPSKSDDGLSKLLVKFDEYQNEVSKWQKSFEVKMYYTKFKDSTNAIEADLTAGGI